MDLYNALSHTVSMSNEKKAALAVLAYEYDRLRSQNARNEELMKGIKGELELAALESGGVLLTDDFKISIVDAEREYFGLKDAKIALGDLLKPFIKMVSFSQLRVTKR